jgi:Zn finger protein HypA/HybF involved in hydrogenase expression
MTYDAYKELIKESEDRLGYKCTLVKYWEDGLTCMECHGVMEFKDNKLICKKCGRVGIYG